MRKAFNSAAASKITLSLALAAAAVSCLMNKKHFSRDCAGLRPKHRRYILDMAAPSISMFGAQQQSIVKRKHSACAKASKWYMSPNDSAIKGLNSRQAHDVTPLNNGDSVALHPEFCKLDFCLIFWPLALQFVWHWWETQPKHEKMCEWSFILSLATQMVTRWLAVFRTDDNIWLFLVGIWNQNQQTQFHLFSVERSWNSGHHLDAGK